MKPVLYSILAMICYALANVIVEQKLARLNTLTIIVCYSGIIFIITLITWLIVRASDPTFQFPKGPLLLIALGVGLLFTLADYCFISAYTSGGKLFVVTSIYVLFPVCASVIKFFTAGEKPNLWHVCGYMCAIIAILCITKGSGIHDSRSLPP